MADDDPGLRLPGVAEFGGFEGYRANRLSLTDAYATSDLFDPQLTEVDGFLVRSAVVGSLENWRDHPELDRGGIESMANHVHVWEGFAEADLDADAYRACEILAQRIADAWRGAAARSHPHRSIAVEVRGDGDGDYGPTVYLFTTD